MSSSSPQESDHPNVSVIETKGGNEENDKKEVSSLEVNKSDDANENNSTTCSESESIFDDDGVANDNDPYGHCFDYDCNDGSICTQGGGAGASGGYHGGLITQLSIDEDYNDDIGDCDNEKSMISVHKSKDDDNGNDDDHPKEIHLNNFTEDEKLSIEDILNGDDDDNDGEEIADKKNWNDHGTRSNESTSDLKISDEKHYQQQKDASTSQSQSNHQEENRENDNIKELPQEETNNNEGVFDTKFHESGFTEDSICDENDAVEYNPNGIKEKEVNETNGIQHLNDNDDGIINNCERDQHNSQSHDKSNVSNSNKYKLDHLLDTNVLSGFTEHSQDIDGQNIKDENENLHVLGEQEPQVQLDKEKREHEVNHSSYSSETKVISEEKTTPSAPGATLVEEGGIDEQERERDDAVMEQMDESKKTTLLQSDTSLRDNNKSAFSEKSRSHEIRNILEDNGEETKNDENDDNKKGEIVEEVQNDSKESADKQPKPINDGQHTNEDSKLEEPSEEGETNSLATRGQHGKDLNATKDTLEGKDEDPELEKPREEDGETKDTLEGKDESKKSHLTGHTTNQHHNSQESQIAAEKECNEEVNGVLEVEEFPEKKIDACNEPKDDHLDEQINSSVGKKNLSMTPMYVYNGITQSLPTQMPTTPNNGESLTKNASTTQDQLSPEVKESSGSHLFEFDNDSLYGASTEVIKSPCSQKHESLKVNVNDLNSVGELVSNNNSLYEVSTDKIKSQNVKSQNETYENSNLSRNDSCVKTPVKSSSEGHVQHSSTDTIEKASLLCDGIVKPNVMKDLHCSEETKTIDGDLVGSDEAFDDSQSDKDRKSIEICESNQLDSDTKSSASKSNTSLLGPTPSQSNDMLSYPHDYPNECSKQDKRIESDKIKGREVTPCGKFNTMNREKNCSYENPRIDESAFHDGKSSGALQTSQNLSEILQEKACLSRTKTLTKLPVRDDIVDSEGEEDKSKSDGEQLHNGGKRSPPPLTFLPPSPGSRKEAQDLVIVSPRLKHASSLIENNVRMKPRNIESKKRGSELIDGGDYKGDIGDEIVEDPSQTVHDMNLQTDEIGVKATSNTNYEHGKLVLKGSGMIAENPPHATSDTLQFPAETIKTREAMESNKIEETLCSLTDTQPNDEQTNECRRDLKRLRRGSEMKMEENRQTKVRTILDDTLHENSFGKENGKEDYLIRRSEYYDADNEPESDNETTAECQSFEVDEVVHSQSTSDIKATLQSLKDINVSKLKQCLETFPVESMKGAKEEIDALRKKNKELQKMNKLHLREKSELQKRLNSMSGKLEEKRKLCDEMKAQLDEVHSLIEVVQAMNVTREKSTSKGSSKKLSKKKKAKQALDQYQSDGGEEEKIKNSDQESIDKGNSKKLSKKKRTKKASDPYQSDGEGGGREKFKNSDQESITTDIQKPRKLNFQTPEAPRDIQRKTVGIVTGSGRKKRNKKRSNGNITFQVLWRSLQESGWKYRRGPEPYGSVYVPPKGNVRKGSVLGKDFFLADDKLWEMAEQLGVIDKMSDSEIENDDDDDNNSNETSALKDSHEEDKINTKPRKKMAYISSPESEENETKFGGSKAGLEIEMEALNDSVLIGPSLVLTEKSASKCIYYIKDFLTTDQKDRSFQKNLWLPLWNCIKDDQGASDKSLGWRYERSRGAGELGRKFWYCPPKSQLGAKGVFSRDYFINEESVVAFILRDLRASGSISTIKIDQELLNAFELRLSRSIEDHLAFDEVNTLSSGKRQRNGQIKLASSPAQKSHITSPSVKTVRVSTPTNFSPQNLPTDNMIPHSQNTMQGAEILLELNKSIQTKESKKAPEYGCIATKNGIKTLVDFRSKSKKRKSPRKSPGNEPPKKKEKLTPGRNACHLTQSPDGLTLRRWVSPAPGNGTNEEMLPLEGFSFFGSGIDVKVANAVTRLGGKFCRDVKGEALMRSKVVKKLFFLSDVINRRTHKYILACALGVPMLHFEWVYALESQFNKYKQQRRATSNSQIGCKFPNVFDSQLYSKYRLPLGLSTESNLYILQRASHAKKWKGLIANNGNLIFTGMTIVVALEDSEGEKKWISILELAGARVLQGSDIDKKKAEVDLVLSDSLLLPPHVTAITSKVSRVLNKISLMSADIPIVDLSWAMQCIVRKNRVDVSEKYKLQIESSLNTSSERIIDILSVKVQQFCGLTRYEVGDSIRFGKKMGQSNGRITAIRYDKRMRKKTIEVKVLELHHECELIDGGKSVSTINLEESELQGHILILSGKDYSQVDWSKTPHVYLQKKKV